MMRRFEDEPVPVRNEDVREATEGAFNVLARFGTTTSRSGGSPMSRWRRSAIRIAASNASRKLREAARLKALQRTPYPLVLARIKLLLDRLTVFKEHVTQTSQPHGMLTANRSRRRTSVIAPGNASRSDVGLDNGGGSRVAAAAAAAAAAAELGDEDDGDEEQLVTSAIRGWDLRRVGGRMPSGPMDNLYGDMGHASRRSSRAFRESRSPTGYSEEEEDGSGSARLRRSPSPTRSMMGAAASAAFTSVASVLVRTGASSAFAGATTEADPESVMGDYDNMALDDPGSGNKMSLDKLLEELSTTMSYVSDFLRKVPEETRMEACFAAKMENYKKDQTVYRIGDPPERFHLILTGVVEIWTHPLGNRREKTLIATLKKGQSFGEMAILNDEPRAEVATPTSNCTFLTFHRADLLSCFGPFFRDRLIAAEKFFHSRVAVFQALPKKETLKVISHMMQSTFPAGKEWEPIADQQIYFIKSGTVTLEALERRAGTTPNTPPAGGGGGLGAPASGHGGTRVSSAHSTTAAGTLTTCSAAGGGGAAVPGTLVCSEDGSGEDGVENEILAAITIVDGRAIGTLGHEDELRRMRRAAIPKKMVATLEPGSHFGGGSRVLGEGELQSCMKVTSNTEIAVYHMHIDQFFKCASTELVRALRDDTAFKLTYYFGRLGSIGQDVVVGHHESSLASTRISIVVGEDEESPLAPIRGPGGLAPRKKKGIKKGGGHSNEVEKVISYMRELEAELDNPGSKNLELYKNGTPAERYYRNPLLCGTARGNALPNIIAGLYTEGLAPLADKVDSLAAKAARRLELYHGDKPAVQRMMSIMAPASPTAATGLPTGFPSGVSGRASSSHSARYTSSLIPGSPSSAGSPAAAAAGGAPSSGTIGARPNSPTRMPSRLGGQRPPTLAVDSGGGGSTAAAADPVRSPGLSPGGYSTTGVTQTPLSPVAGPRVAAAGALRVRPRSSPHTGAPAIIISTPSEANTAAATAADYIAPLRRSGALTAASYIWQRMRDIGGRAPPQVRQCLTYDEIAHVRTEAKRALAGGPVAAPPGPGGTNMGTGTGSGSRPQPQGSLTNSQSGYSVAAGDAGRVSLGTFGSSKTMTSPLGA